VGNAVAPTADGRFAVAGKSYFRGESGSEALLVLTTLDPMAVSDPPISVLPASHRISAYPNPFNGVVNLSFEAARPGYYALEMVDPAGRSVGRLFEGYAGVGEKKVVWDAGEMAAGGYFVKVSERGGIYMVKPAVLLK